MRVIAMFFSTQLQARRKGCHNTLQHLLTDLLNAVPNSLFQVIIFRMTCFVHLGADVAPRALSSLLVQHQSRCARNTWRYSNFGKQTACYGLTCRFGHITYRLQSGSRRQLCYEMILLQAGWWLTGKVRVADGRQGAKTSGSHNRTSAWYICFGSYRTQFEISVHPATAASWPPGAMTQYSPQISVWFIHFTITHHDYQRCQFIKSESV